MKRAAAVFGVMLAVFAIGNAHSQTSTATLSWDAAAGNVTFQRAAPSGDVSASLTVQGHGDAATGSDGRVGIDVVPTDGVLPTQHALAETTVYGTTDRDTNYRRFNIAQMADGTVRLGNEIGGDQVHHDIIFSEDGYPYRASATQPYLIVKGQRTGNSQPIAIQNGHLRFDLPNMGGAASDYYVARGGSGTLDLNVPTGSRFEFMVNNQPVFVIDATGGHAP